MVSDNGCPLRALNSATCVDVHSLSPVAIKCRLRGVPDELRQSLRRSLGSTSADSGAGSGAEVAGEKEEEAKLDHPYDILTRFKIDLEPYVLLVQVCMLTSYQ